MFRPSSHFDDTRNLTHEKVTPLPTSLVPHSPNPGRVDTTAKPNSQNATRTRPPRAPGQKRKQPASGKALARLTDASHTHKKSSEKARILASPARELPRHSPSQTPSNAPLAPAAEGCGNESQKRYSQHRVSTWKYEPTKPEACHSKGRAVANESRPRELQWAQLATDESPMTRLQPRAEPKKNARGNGNRPAHEQVRRHSAAPRTGRTAENEPDRPKRRPRRPFTAGRPPLAKETQEPRRPADNRR